ncbi:MAG: hypothetical protein K9K76_11490 [Halanaerobiales bacterium]|nr:hypothetical protein [Halanaerobiales bacterium]
MIKTLSYKEYEQLYTINFYDFTNCFGEEPKVLTTSLKRAKEEPIVISIYIIVS